MERHRVRHIGQAAMSERIRHKQITELVVYRWAGNGKHRQDSEPGSDREDPDSAHRERPPPGAAPKTGLDPPKPAGAEPRKCESPQNGRDAKKYFNSKHFDA